MTEKQFLEIKRRYSSSQIINIINNLENYIPTPKKYRNVYLTFKKWAEKEYGESNNNMITKTADLRGINYYYRAKHLITYNATDSKFLCIKDTRNTVNKSFAYPKVISLV